MPQPRSASHSSTTDPSGIITEIRTRVIAIMERAENASATTCTSCHQTIVYVYTIAVGWQWLQRNDQDIPTEECPSTLEIDGIRGPHHPQSARL